MVTRWAIVLAGGLCVVLGVQSAAQVGTWQDTGSRFDRPWVSDWRMQQTQQRTTFLQPMQRFDPAARSIDTGLSQGMDSRFQDRFGTSFDDRFGTSFDSRFGTSFDDRFDTQFDDRFDTGDRFNQPFIDSRIGTRPTQVGDQPFIDPRIGTRRTQIGDQPFINQRFGTEFDSRFNRFFTPGFHGGVDDRFDLNRFERTQQRFRRDVRPGQQFEIDTGRQPMDGSQGDPGRFNGRFGGNRFDGGFDGRLNGGTGGDGAGVGGNGAGNGGAGGASGGSGGSGAGG